MADDFPNEFKHQHTAVIHFADKYEDTKRRTSMFGTGIDAIIGVKPEDEAGPRGGRTEIQSIIFDARTYDIDEVEDFLDRNNFDPIDVKEASMEVEDLGRENPHGSGYGMPWSAIAAVGGFVLGSFLSSDN